MAKQSAQCFSTKKEAETFASKMNKSAKLYIYKIYSYHNGYVVVKRKK